MSTIEDRVNDLEYKVHELREEININYKHISEILILLKKKFPDEFEPDSGVHLKPQK
jgi:hypothetical protein